MWLRSHSYFLFGVIHGETINIITASHSNLSNSNYLPQETHIHANGTLLKPVALVFHESQKRPHEAGHSTVFPP